VHVCLRVRQRRGIATVGADGKASLRVKDYPYAEDGLLIWEAIDAWVGEYLSLYYKDDAAVAGDPEINAWWEEIKCVASDLPPPPGHGVDVSGSIDQSTMICLPFHPSAHPSVWPHARPSIGLPVYSSGLSALPKLRDAI
jgi:Lipoxygenase